MSVFDHPNNADQLSSIQVTSSEEKLRSRDEQVIAAMITEFGYLPEDEQLRQQRIQGALVAVDHQGQVVYPRFQFVSGTDRPSPDFTIVMLALPLDDLTLNETCLWWMAADENLEMHRPVDLLEQVVDKPDKLTDLVEAAIALGRPSAL